MCYGNVEDVFRIRYNYTTEETNSIPINIHTTIKIKLLEIGLPSD